MNAGDAHPGGDARAAALAAVARHVARPTAAVAFRSTGALLVIGSYEQAVAVAARLHPKLRCTVVVPPDEPGRGAEPAPGFPVLGERLIQVSGHLGQYAAVVAAPPPEGGINLLQKLRSPKTHFDLVLDLSDPPFIDRELPPYGYCAPRGDPAALERALAELPEMIGEFEKPRFFHYDPDICAHGASGIGGCTRCLDACPASAIESIREEVAVDPYLCQGAGICATVCPTGAITYVYPALSDQINRIALLLRSYREAGGGRPVLLLHDAETGLERYTRIAPRLPEWVLPYQLAELGSAGMEAWLAMLAHGAAAVALLPAATPPRMVTALRGELAQTGAILEGMGYAGSLVRLLEGGDEAVIGSLAEAPAAPAVPPAGFSGFDEKRTMQRLAIEHLLAQAPAARESVALPAGAAFGAVRVDREACTLCMACVGVCPASALSDGGDLPQLQFIEGNCVQCALCERSCPEDAIRLEPRYLYSPEARRTSRVLNQETPFLCVSCGKPFATRKMMEHMGLKLEGHWMFQSPEARQRMRMCGDCRVRDMFQAERARPGGDA